MAAGSAEPAAAPPQTVLFPILERGRWGFIDASGRVLISPRFESIVPVATEREDGSAGGGRGKPDELFLAPSVTPETTAIVAVRSRGRWGFVDHEGRLLPPRFDQVGAFSEGLAPVRQGELWGFVGASGTLDVPVRFDQAGAFVGGVAIVGQDLRYGVIDREGRFVVRARFESIRPADSVFQDNRALVTQFDKKGYVSRAGNVAVPAMFEAASPFSEGLAAVTRAGQTGYIDTTGRWVIAQRWWTAERFSRGRAVVIVNSQCGYIDRSGAYVAKPQFTDARAFTSDDRAVAWKGPIRGLVDLSGRWSPSRMDELQRLDDTLSVAIISGRKGLVRRATSEMIREYPWEELGPFAEGLAHVGGHDGLLGFVDLDGRVAIPPRFRRVGRFDHGLCKATTRDTLGYIDRSGAWVWSTRFR
jgi:WG repeat protein